MSISKIITAATALAACALLVAAAACSSPAAPVAQGSAAKGCHDLAAWENSTGQSTSQTDFSLQHKVALDARGTRFARDFVSWATSSNAEPLANKVISDCAAAGVPDVLNGGASVNTAPATQATQQQAGEPPGDAPAAPGPDTKPNALGGPLDCNTVVDPGPPSAAAQQVISGLSAVSISPATVPSQTDASILDTASSDLINYSGTRLANDASQFVQDEQSFDPSGSVEVSLASTVQADITALTRDCPSH
jgi:hypothetical protein